MEAIEEYLKDKEKALNESISKMPEGPDQAIQNAIEYFNFAQLLACIGRQKEAIPFFQRSWDTAVSYVKVSGDPDENPYCTVAYSIGMQYANALDYINEGAACEKVFDELNQSTFKEGPHIGDYAFFLHRRKRDFDKAEAVYKRALTLFPDHSAIQLKYAGFLRHVRRNVPAAEEHYKLAASICDEQLKTVGQQPENPEQKLQLGSNAADAYGSYASFLHGVHHKIDEAEVFYKKAVVADETHANNLCNYGLFLSEEKKDYVEAENMYKKVLHFTPNHANTLYNYAVLLDTHLKRKVEAEVYYRQTLELEPRHAYALYNLAVLLEEKYFNNFEEKVSMEEEATRKKELLDLYRRAAEADPRDGTTLADYGRYVYVRLQDFDQAEPLLLASLKLDSHCEVALYHLGNLIYRERKNLDAAEILFKKLLAKNPSHGNGTVALARVYADKVQALHNDKNVNPDKISEYIQESIDHYEKSVTLVKEPGIVITEYLKFVTMFASNRQKLNAIKNMNVYITGEKPLNGQEHQVMKAPLTSDTIENCKNLMNEIKAVINA